MATDLNCSDGVIRTDFEAVRAEVIAAMRNKLATFNELSYSDIVRTIFSVLQEERRELGAVSLFVYSDLIENSDYFPSKYLFSYNLQRLIFSCNVTSCPRSQWLPLQVAGVGRAGSADQRVSKSRAQRHAGVLAGLFKDAGAASISIGQNPISSGGAQERSTRRRHI